MWLSRLWKQDETHPRERINWARQKVRYAKTSLTYQDIAEDLGVSLKTVKKHGAEEHWRKARTHYRAEFVTKQLQQLR